MKNAQTSVIHAVNDKAAKALLAKGLPIGDNTASVQTMLARAAANPEAAAKKAAQAAQAAAKQAAAKQAAQAENEAAASRAAAKQAENEAAAKKAAGGLAFHMLQGFRPMAGSALFAHTAAFLELSGLDAGKTLPRATVARCMGDTAVKHHLNSTGFLEQTSAGVTVSSMGREAFALRSIDPELKAGFLDILSTGKTDRKMPDTFKNAKGIKAL